MSTIYSFGPDGINAVLDLVKKSKIIQRPQGVRKKFKEQREVLNLVTAFDIESSTIHIPKRGTGRDEHSFMYIWQWAFDDVCIYGRTWDEFQQLCNMIRGALDEMESKPLLIVYVHNLSYEFQFLSGLYEFDDDEVFAMRARKILYCRMLGYFEFRCSYLQSNMTLDKFARFMGCCTLKKSGDEFNYSKVRYPWTDLTETELEYCTSDVLCLTEAIKNEMARDGDTLLTIPYTSTGYVRRDCKRAIAPLRRYYIKPMLPDIPTYRILRKAFRGGNCHANPYYAGRIINNVVSYDMVSCYPAQQLTQLFPVSPFRMLSAPLEMWRISGLIERGRAVIGTYRFYGLELKDRHTPIPYLSLAKTNSYKFRLDNGRILYADICETTLTEIDLAIVIKQYKFKSVAVIEAMTAEKGPLPEEYKSVIRKYYEQKTELKSASKHDPEAAYQYAKSKNRLNAIYGMSATDPVHQRIQYAGGEYIVSDYDTEGASEELEKAPFPYQWGVYTTAYARQQLQIGIDAAGTRLIYSDTDSIKVDGEIDLTEINAARVEKAIQYRAFADDDKGVRHYMGVFENDGVYQTFITQGAKRYAYIDEDGHMGVTVSGVTKARNPDTGVEYAVEELGRLENFKEGFIWVKAGGAGSVYNDDDFIYLDPETAREVVITKNVSIVDTTYEMTITKDYARLLRELQLYHAWRKEVE